MKQFLMDLFSENGAISMMRVMSLIALLIGGALAFVGLSKLPVDYSGISILVSVFLSAAFGGKVLQKRIEVNGAKSDVNVDMNSPDKKDE
jgi:hypothetical protein